MRAHSKPSRPSGAPDRSNRLPTMTTTNRALRYRPEIDGLRAVAVIPVVLFHLGWSGIGGGYLGVDVFFVISGYLITSLLIRELDRGDFALGAFWLRRIRRIFPALAVMLTLTSLAGAFLFLGNDDDTLGRTGIAAVLSFSNVALWRLTDGYWGATAETFPLLHTWSLSVEEQFYFLYPFLLALLFRFARGKMAPLLACAALVSFASYCYGSAHHPDATFYLLPTRAWELACGCLLSLAEWKGLRKPDGSSPLAAAGLIAILASYHFLSKAHAFPGALAIVVGGSLLVLAFATHPAGFVYRLLAARPVVFVGKISYSLYLWHWPVLVLTRNHNAVADRPIPEWLTVPAILACSLTSYYLVETTTRHRKRILKPALAGFGVSFAVSCLVLARNLTFDFSVFAPIVWEGRKYDVRPAPEQWTGWMRERMAGIDSPVRNDGNAGAFKTSGILKQYGTNGVDMVVLGDSHGLMWAGLLDEIAQDLHLTVSFFTTDGVSPFSAADSDAVERAGWTAEDAAALKRARDARLMEWRPKLVFLLARWSSQTSTNGTERLFALLDEAGCRVLTIEQPPELYFGDKNAPRELLKLGFVPQPGVDRYLRFLSGERGKAYATGAGVVSQLEAVHPRFTCVRIRDLFLQGDSKARVLAGTHVLYIDDDHLSRDGAAVAKQRIRQAIESGPKEWEATEARGSASN